MSTESQPVESPESDDVDGLHLDAVQEVAGELVEGRSLQVLLEDGRVAVARIRQIQTGDVQCRVSECFCRFDTERAMESHVGKQHPEARYRECPVCEEEFKPKESSQTYCSNACYHEDGRERITCENCGDDFQVKASHAENRRHCSRECRVENGYSDSDHSDRENSRVEAECAHCDGIFEHYPSRTRQYCSLDCKSADKHETRECPMCAAEFEVRKSKAQEYCSRQCFFESRNDRPFDEHDLLVELIRDGHDLDTVRARAKAHLGVDWNDEAAIETAAASVAAKDGDDLADKAARLQELLDETFSEIELQHRLVDGAIASNEDVPTHVHAEDVLDVYDDVETMYEFGRELRMGRTPSRALLSRSGLGAIDGTDARLRAKQRLEDLSESPGDDTSYDKYRLHGRRSR